MKELSKSALWFRTSSLAQGDVRFLQGIRPENSASPLKGVNVQQNNPFL